MSQELIALKLTHKGETHRLRVDLERLTLKHLKELFHSTFTLPQGYHIQYKDNEGDIITIGNDVEFVEACRVFLKLNGDSKTMSFYANRPFVFSQTVEPIVKAVEEFTEEVRQAAIKMAAKTKEQEWAQKCQEKSQKAVESIKKSAQETTAFFEEQRKTFQESEFCFHAKEFFEDVKTSFNELLEPVTTLPRTAVRNSPLLPKKVGEKRGLCEISSVECNEAIDCLINEIESKQNIQEEEEEQMIEEQKDAIEEDAVEISKSQDLDTSGDDWEMLEDSNRKWEKEYASIRLMLPEARYERCEKLLERYNGNVQVTINALMDM